MSGSKLKDECPACGLTVGVRQKTGGIRAHSGRNGCPYVGTGFLTLQGVHPFKFDSTPLMVAAAAYVEDGLAATIRYDPERTPEERDYISIRTTGSEIIGLARVEEVITGELLDVSRAVRRSNARYWYNQSTALLDAMNGYYEPEIDFETSVQAYIYKPWFDNLYKPGPHHEDRV